MAIGRWSDDAEGPALHFIKSRGTSIGETPSADTRIEDDDLIGQLRFMVDDGSDYAAHAATIRVEIDGTVDSSDDVPGAITFNTTADGASGGTERMRIDSTGAVTKPTKPAFFAGTTDLLEDVTGDGTAYTIIWPTEQFDSGDDDYDTSNGKFTAPVAGRYQFNSCVWMTGLTSSHTAAEVQLKTSDCPAIQFWYGNPYVSADSGHFAVSGSCIIDMDAADTAEMVLTVAHGTKVVDIGASGSATHPRAHFSGFLAT
jgi:hypothetical protein